MMSGKQSVKASSLIEGQVSGTCLFSGLSSVALHKCHQKVHLAWAAVCTEKQAAMHARQARVHCMS